MFASHHLKRDEIARSELMKIDNNKFDLKSN